MSMLSRRIFVQDGFKVVSLGLAMPHIFTRAVEAAGQEAGRDDGVVYSPETASGDPFADRTLIVVQMAGGNDGLNTVVPYADGTYYSQRKNLGIPEADVLKLDERAVLQPNEDTITLAVGAGQRALEHAAIDRGRIGAAFLGTCTNPPVANGTSCDDGNWCNGTETCQSGACQSSGAPTSFSQCGTSCPANYYAASTTCSSQCGSPSGPRATCNPACASSAAACGGCPAGYHPASTTCSAQCGSCSTTSGQRFTCNQDSGSSFSSCEPCPSGYHAASTTCSAQCGSCSATLGQRFTCNQDSGSSFSVCGACPSGYYAASTTCSAQCGSCSATSGLRSTCNATGSSSFTTCGSACPAGYHSTSQTTSPKRRKSLLSVPRRTS